MSHLSLVSSCIGCNHLKNSWYQALEVVGFEDAEKKKYGGDFLNYTRKRNPEYVQQNQDYYIWATQALHLKKFKSHMDQNIWEFHINGATSTAISNNTGIDRSLISKKIKIIERYLKQK